jgi:hypothetical protein
MQTQENIVPVSTTKGIDVGKIEKEGIEIRLL